MDCLEKKLGGLVNYYPHELRMDNIGDMSKLARRLYGEEYAEVTLARKVMRFNAKCFKATTACRKKARYFVIKKARREGGIKEGIGQELYNIATGKNRNYICNQDFFASEFIQGMVARQDVYRVLNSEEYKFRKGVLDEFADFLRLRDRNEGNIIITKQKEVVHIDFGMLFATDYVIRDIRCFEEDAYLIGRKETINKLYKNIAMNLKKTKMIFGALTPGFVQMIDPIGNMLRYPCQHLYTYALSRGWIEMGEDLFDKLEKEAIAAADF